MGWGYYEENDYKAALQRLNNAEGKALSPDKQAAIAIARAELIAARLRYEAGEKVVRREEVEGDE